jgi:hypothetical protein
MVQATTRSRVHAPPRFHIIFMVLALWMIVGVFVDGWAHINIASTKETFFTPWHGVLYSGFAAAVAWGMLPVFRGRRQGVIQAIPYGYGLGFVGLGIFLVGGAGDATWHVVFGIETGIDALLSPTHLLLLTGGLLALTAPLRAAWVEVDTTEPSLPELLPAVLSLTLTTAILAFFLGYAWGVLDPTPSLPVHPAALDENSPQHFPAERGVAFGIVARIVTTVLLLAPVLFAMRRWRLPFGTTTILFTTVTALMYFLFYEGAARVAGFTPVDLGLVGLSAVVAGVAGDVFIRRINASIERPLTVYAFGGVVALVLWSLNMASIWAARGMGWTPELWSGTVVLCTLAAIGLAVVVAPPGSPHTSRRNPL